MKKRRLIARRLEFIAYWIVLDSLECAGQSALIAEPALFALVGKAFDLEHYLHSRFTYEFVVFCVTAEAHGLADGNVVWSAQIPVADLLLAADS